MRKKYAESWIQRITQSNILTLKQNTLETSVNQNLVVAEFCVSSETLSSATVTLTTSSSEDIITNYLVNSNFISNSMESQEISFFFSTVNNETQIRNLVLPFLYPQKSQKLQLILPHQPQSKPWKWKHQLWLLK